MLSSLFFILILGCELDQTFNQEIIVTEAATSDLLVQAMSESPVKVPFGCPTSESFLIQSIGEQAVIILDITVLVSAGTSATLDSPLPVFPLSLAPEENIIVTVILEAANDEEDTVMINVVSDDPGSPRAAVTLLQPQALEKVRDIFIAEAGQAIDLLLVIDNSGSMSSEQSRLIANAPHIIDGLNRYSFDYHVGVITTDSPKFVGDFLTEADLNAVDDLSIQMNLGTSGNSTERGIQYAIEATSAGGDAAPGSPFLRDDAHLAIVWISDEDDYSSGVLSDWATHFWSLKTSPSDVIGWAIVTDTMVNCPTAYPGLDYIGLSAALGGSWTQICNEDWQLTFENLAATAGTISSYPLSDIPFIPSIEVEVDGVASNDWVYVTGSNSVSFNPGHIPVIDSVVHITYGVAACE